MDITLEYMPKHVLVCTCLSMYDERIAREVNLFENGIETFSIFKCHMCNPQFQNEINLKIQF